MDALSSGSLESVKERVQQVCLCSGDSCFMSGNMETLSTVHLTGECEYDLGEACLQDNDIHRVDDVLREAFMTSSSCTLLVGMAKVSTVTKWAWQQALTREGSQLVQWEIVLLMQYCDRVDQSMKLSTVFVEGMYSNIRRGAIQIYIPLQKYVLQETLVNIVGPSRMTATNSIMTTPSHLPSTTHMSQKLSNTN